MTDRLDRFLAFGTDVTAFTVFELQGTRLAESYLLTVAKVVGEELVDQLLNAHDEVVKRTPRDLPGRDDLLRKNILGDETLGPIARNIIKLWYIGIWYELPRAWTDAFGTREENYTRMVSAAAYAEGLLWSAIGAHPPGAKAPGYGSWSEPPRIPAVP